MGGTPDKIGGGDVFWHTLFQQFAQLNGDFDFAETISTMSAASTLIMVWRDWNGKYIIPSCNANPFGPCVMLRHGSASTAYVPCI